MNAGFGPNLPGFEIFDKGVSVEECGGLVPLAIIFDRNLRDFAEIYIVPDRLGIIFRIDDFQIPEAGLFRTIEADQFFVTVLQFVIAEDIVLPVLALGGRHVNFADVI